MVCAAPERSAKPWGGTAFGRQCPSRGQSCARERAVVQRRQRRTYLAEDYDRDLTDVFAIQTDLAQKIALSLQAKLSLRMKKNGWIGRRHKIPTRICSLFKHTTTRIDQNIASTIC